jgi:uncharacterized DUF497 family protein
VVGEDKTIEKLVKKHNIQQDEVHEVFGGNPKFRFVEKGFYPNEKIYAALGRSKAGRFLILFFIFKKNMHALILSARDMTGTERKKYEQQ